MINDEGGGASRSTDPASGSSAATDVSLREYLAAQTVALKELMQAHRAADQLAIKTALDSAHLLAEKHNDLIRQQERKDATYATKKDLERVESWQAKITGGLVVVGAIGVANLVKLLTG